MQRDPTNDDVFEFQNFDINNGLITLRRIFDGNGIILRNINSTKAANFRKMFYEKFCDEWMFLDMQVEHRMRLNLRRDKDYQIMLHYQVIYDPFTGDKQCFISSVEPKRIG